MSLLRTLVEHTVQDFWVILILMRDKCDLWIRPLVQMGPQPMGKLLGSYRKATYEKQCTDDTA